MANKLGTIVEDLAAPSLLRVIEEKFGQPVLDLMVRWKRRLAALGVDEGLVRHAEKQGFMVLATGDQLMEIRNRPGFEPKRWTVRDEE